MRLLPLVLAIAACGAAAGACSSSGDGGAPSDAGTDVARRHDAGIPFDGGPDVGYPAPHPPQPQVVKMNGPVQTAPNPGN